MKMLFAFACVFKGLLGLAASADLQLPDGGWKSLKVVWQGNGTAAVRTKDGKSFLSLSLSPKSGPRARPELTLTNAASHEDDCVAGFGQGLR